MNNGEIDRLPVSQLIERYDLARSAVYKRLEALRIKPKKIGNKAYVSAEQVMLMDDLHRFIQAGGNTAEFLDSRGLDEAEADQPNLSSGLSKGQPDMVQLVAAIASEMASRFQPQLPEPDPLAYFKALEEAARNGWLLRTSELSYLLDLTPAEIKSYGDRFSEAGFTFTRAGYRSKGEVAWKVSKPLK
ncbi:MAG: hypothetical protein F6K19_47080 [Cyanothece sp. SIO1E1]|nr:hypothetical protein [Cyanothece sp. SIO1E1]